MNKLRLTDARAAVARVANLNSTDSRVVDIINEATERLLKRGKWLGTVQRYRICTSDGCITWPRQIETIEAFAVCQTPGVVRNGWYEFLAHGPGLVKDDDCWLYTLIDRGTACTFDDITKGVTNRKVRVYADLSETASARIIVQGYDENGNWIRTTNGSGDLIDGEEIALALSPGTISTKKFTAITGIIKSVTNGAIRLYEYNADTAANTKVLGYYEHDETLPIYRRSLLPGLADMGACDGSAADCTNKYVTVKAKLNFIPVRNNNDWIMLTDLPALKLAAKAVVVEENVSVAEAEQYWGKAVVELEHALRNHEGDGAVGTPNVQDRAVFGAGAVENVI